MTAAAVVYVGDLERMRAFYQGCFGLTVTDAGDAFCGLSSDDWLLTLVRTEDARPSTDPAPRRSATAVKLSFTVASLADLRPIVSTLGGAVEPAENAWEFRHATHCDCVDPEGNVIALIEPRVG